MDRHTKIGLALLFFTALLLSTLIAWAVISTENFDRHVRPGDSYTVGNRTYTFPKIPVKYMRSSKAPSTDVKVPILSDKFLQNQRQLLIDVSEMLTGIGIVHWVSGGTMLGFKTFKTALPWDDDSDMHTLWKHRPYLYGEQIVRDADVRDLEIFHLPKANIHQATREGAAVRFRRKGTWSPTLDLFFEKKRPDGKWGKVDGWLGDSVYFNKREVWPAEDLFPIQAVEIDDMTVYMPAHPERLLTQQYGKGWADYRVIVDPLLSHHFVFRFLDLVWQVRKPKPLEEDASGPFGKVGAKVKADSVK